MDFFYSLKKNFSAAADYTAKKATDLTEIAKLRAEISSLQKKLDTVFLELGKTLYHDGIDQADCSEKMDAYRKKADAIRARITTLQERLAKARGRMICPACGTEIALEMQFCPQCGAKMTKASPAVQNETAAPAEDTAEAD